MMWRIFVLCSVLVFSSFCVFAQSDSSGNIAVELTRLDESQSYTFILVVIVAVLFILIATLVVVMRRRFSYRAAVKEDISVKQVRDDSFRGRDYYAKVFDNAPRSSTITDEKSNMTCLIDENVDRYLKEDERIIINVLRMKHNSCTQATLRVVTDFSKARLSRLLSELEERGVIYKEQSGRKNLITLKT